MLKVIINLIMCMPDKNWKSEQLRLIISTFTYFSCQLIVVFDKFHVVIKFV